MPPRTRIDFEAFRKEGLEVLWLEGPGSDVMEYWAFTEQWNYFLTQVLTYAKLVPRDNGLRLGCGGITSAIEASGAVNT
jgi:hypothetical protein